MCGEGCEWNEEKIGWEKIDIISVVSGMEKEHRSPEMECLEKRKARVAGAQ